LTGGIECELQILIGTVGIELPQWVVQEVESREAELQALALTDFEVLEQGQIAIEVRRALDIGPNDAAVGSDGRSSKAAWVKVLPGFQVAARIASQSRDQCFSICSQDLIVSHPCGPHNVKISTGIGLNRSAALPLGHAGELPAVYSASEKCIALYGARQIPNVGSVEYVSVVVSENAVVIA